MSDLSWLPLALSVTGALISFFSMLSIAIIGFLMKYVLQNTERRILQLEAKVEAHASHVATATAQTASEQKMFSDLRNDIHELRAEVRTVIASTGRSLTPPRVPRPDPRIE